MSHVENQSGCAVPTICDLGKRYIFPFGTHPQSGWVYVGPVTNISNHHYMLSDGHPPVSQDFGVGVSETDF